MGRLIVHLASEAIPLAKVGGLADMVGTLAAEQARRGDRAVVVLPAWRDRDVPTGWSRRALPGAEVPWGLGKEPASFELLSAPDAGLRFLLVDHAGVRRFFDRPGIYDDPTTRQGYADNGERFLFFARAALAGLRQLGEPVDVLHAHDHQAAWAPCFARTHEAETFAGAATVFTIHNLGYQGIHDAWVLALAGFGGELFYPASPFEFWGRVNYMKVGIAFADMISTVSPRYAEEIRSSPEFGFGLEGVLSRRAADVRGILNGIDDAYWDPSRDPTLAAHYDREDLDGKARCRAALLAECGFTERHEWPVVGVVARLVDQKGFDLLERAEADLPRLEARLVVLGAGEARYEQLFHRLAAAHPQKFHYRPGYDEAFAHRIEAGADLFLMPSRYEPCGLNQMYSLRYGTPPVVRATGGLADTVEDFDPATRRGTGFLFQRYEASEMIAALRRAFTIYRQPHLWSALQSNGMAKDFSWRCSADGYDRLYDEAQERVRAGNLPTLESVRAALAV